MIRCVATCAVAAVLSGGCTLPANPRTTFGYGPVQFYDSKDNDVELEGLDVNPATGTYKVQRLKVQNNASKVREANVEQMAAFAQQLSANWQGANQTLSTTLGAILPAVLQYRQLQNDESESRRRLQAEVLRGIENALAPYMADQSGILTKLDALEKRMDVYERGLPPRAPASRPGGANP